jgi:hypothetical protein
VRWSNRNKYGAVKVKALDGTVYDSKKEHSRAIQLEMLLRAGKIKDLKRQVPFELIPAQYETVERYGKNGKRLKDGKKLIERKCEYVADFTYIDTETGEYVVEDVKGGGVRTKDYLIKRKLMLLVHGIKLREV